MRPPVTTSAAALSTQLTSFIGRTLELTELAELLDSVRMLTLTGAGGCGKTRLSLQLVSNTRDRFPGGVWLLELAPIADSTLIDSALAAAVGIRPLPGRTPVEAVVAHLAPLRALVLLDNCEHVLEACREIAADLLRGCPELTIVATSREPLGLGGEAVWRVPSLEESEAARLFNERAVKVRPNFAITSDNEASVLRICRDLSGIPLAIELAAARVRVLSVERIATELGDRFRLLTGGERGALPRLQTLRASVDWSYELLDPPERTLFRRCSAFQGGFTLDACEEVCADEELDRYAVLDLLTSLVDKSLVLVDERSGMTRYTMLETIRQYAVELLVEAGEVSALRVRHVDAFLAFAETTSPSLGTDVGSVDAVAADSANLLAAIDNAANVEPEKALRLCSALAYWWLLTGRPVEGLSALTRALDAAVDHHGTLRCSALFWRGYLAFFAGEFDRTQQDGADALVLTRKLGDRMNEGRVLNMLGLFETQPNPRAALPILERACELARVAADEWCLPDAMQNVGWALILMGEYDRARPHLDASFEMAQRAGLGEVVAWHWWFAGQLTYPAGDIAATRANWERCLDTANDLHDGMASWSLGLLEADEGKPAVALDRLNECWARMIAGGAGMSLPFVKGGIGHAHAVLGELDVARGELCAAADGHAGGFVWAQALALLDLAQIERLDGDVSAAVAFAEQALAVAERIGHVGITARARVQLARAAAARGDWSDAERLVHQALAVQMERGDVIDVPDTLDALAEVVAGLESYSEAARLLGAATQARVRLGLVRWIPLETEADALLARLCAALGTDAAADAVAEGGALPLSEATAYALRARSSRRRPSHGWESLTQTELEVVRHAAAGMTNPEIAERMFISRGTVKVHLSHIYAKLGLRNRSEVAAEAARRQT